MRDSLSNAAARRIALAAQGFGASRPPSVGTRQLNGLMQRIRLLQLDSVNVFERSHYLPAFARLGPYDKAVLDRLTFARRPRHVESWAHVASLIPIEDWPLLGWRRQWWRERSARKADGWAASNGEMLDWLRAELAEKGPQTIGMFEHEAAERRGPWWGWSDVKLGLEHLFLWGEVVPAGRRNFERRYALAEDVIPAELRDQEVPATEAKRRLVEGAARAHGVGTVKDLADYYRLSIAEAKAAIADLVEAGALRPVTVEGWTAPAYLHRDARIPRRLEAAALLSPFDPVVWERDRALRMFGFHYRIEIYTPAPKRVYGYYTLPVLLDEALVGRVDLKSDRRRGVLRVQSAWRESGAPASVEERVVPLLDAAAAWQGLDRIEVVDRGDLARRLAGALGVPTVAA